MISEQVEKSMKVTLKLLLVLVPMNAAHEIVLLLSLIFFVILNFPYLPLFPLIFSPSLMNAYLLLSYL